MVVELSVKVEVMEIHVHVVVYVNECEVMRELVAVAYTEQYCTVEMSTISSTDC